MSSPLSSTNSNTALRFSQRPSPVRKTSTEEHSASPTPLDASRRSNPDLKRSSEITKEDSHVCASPEMLHFQKLRSAYRPRRVTRLPAKYQHNYLQYEAQTSRILMTHRNVVSCPLYRKIIIRSNHQAKPFLAAVLCEKLQQAKSFLAAAVCQQLQLSAKLLYPDCYPGKFR